MAYMVAANMVSDALSATYTHGVDVKICLDDVTNYPAVGGVYIDDDDEWVLQIYSVVDVPNDELETLSDPVAVFASAGAVGHIFPIGTVVKHCQLAEYPNQMVNDIIGAPAGAIFYEDTDEIGSSVDLTFDGTTFKCDKAAIFNDSEADVDYRWGANGITDAVFFQGSDGFVGFGTGTPDRLTHAEIADAATNTVVYAQRLAHITSNAAIAGFGVGIEFELEENDGTNRIAAYITTDWEDAGEGAAADGRLNFGVMTGDGAAVTAMSIWNGRVGIGTTTPGSTLYVKGAAACDISIDGATGEDSTLAFQENGVNEWWIYHDSDDGSNLHFRQKPGADLDVFTLSQAGNAGLGTGTFQAAAIGCFAIASATPPGAATADQIYFYSKDATVVGGATLGIYSECAVEVGVPTVSHKIRWWINETEYWIGLDPV